MCYIVWSNAYIGGFLLKLDEFTNDRQCVVQICAFCLVFCVSIHAEMNSDVQPILLLYSIY